MGDSISEGTIVQWMKAEGDSVAVDDVLVVLETDKVSVDVRSPEAGTLAAQLAGEGDTVQVSDKPPPPPPKAAPKEPKSEPEAPPKSEAPKEEAPKQTPAKKEPKQEPVKAEPAAPALAPGQKVSLPPIQSAPTTDRTETRIKMTRMRQRIAERLKSAQNTAAMLTTFQEMDMSRLMALRGKYKEEFEKKHGVKLGFMSAFVKASADALREIPAVNGYIDEAAKEIVHRNYVDISVAVASPQGLVVPVLRNVEDMSFADIEKAIADYAVKAKAGKLALEDMAGGSFTISNGGVFGSLMGTPIINPPQSAILGMHATKMRAVVVDGQVVARPMMYLALTYDHRMVDGREAVTFLKSVANKIEDPSRLLLDL
ncbi:dihydrolipoamide succinyltransferase [Tribonema minus]|uniref:dihydrolipoyllysine-residue succinyltransferase n=1 Tax=Tribonema minus TaxID=303371 RepID=A0A835Z206_9STRA|nr:dihydrolipoamide succinyltransferase [Tribonema minus]